jgi:hypothetical protein
MTAAGSAIRNAAMVVATAVGRFGDLGKPDKYHKGRIGGTRKFKDVEDPLAAGQPDETGFGPEKFELWELPRKYTFRDWCDYWRQFTRRAFVFHEGGQYLANRPRHSKKIGRAIRRARVRAMKEGGHFKGDNRPVFFRPTVKDAK